MTDKTFNQLESLVDDWAIKRSIYSQGTSIGQSLKTQEEALELTTAIVEDNPEEIKDAIGDILVTVIIQAHMQGWGVTSCLDHAYEQIKDRKGEMVDGKFVKRVS